jgi:hypothetical protein
MSRVTCTYHCAACNGHFHSERAFDTHRHGEGRTCIELLDDDRFAALATDAKCELQRVPYTPLEAGNRQVYPAGWKPGDPPMQRVIEPVTVWTLAARLEGARERWSAGALKATDGLEGPEAPQSRGRGS